jgi:putative DNA primase/helicase
MNATTATTPEWETPSHEEINLATVNPEDLGLDPYDMSDPRVKAIYEAQSKPHALIPAELRAKPNWVRWKLETVNGRSTKVPYQLSGAKASSTDPTTWATYDAISSGAVLSENQGIGVVTDGSFVGFDLDGCRNPQTGEIKEWAQRIINSLGTYTEVTPSGYGMRVYTLGQLPENSPRRFSLTPTAGFGDKVAIEVYDKERYFTVTGNRFGDTSKIDSSNALQAYDLCRIISRELKPEKTQRTASNNNDGMSVQIERAPGKPIPASKLAILMDGTV